MALIRNIFWIAFFVVATFAFIVLFEHGPTNFADNAKRELTELSVIFGVQSKADSKKSP
ncbi:MAG: hypothetical protein RL088_159 [Verrucomicrobiota bacterium]|jgi:hypothetical protein